MAARLQNSMSCITMCIVLLEGVIMYRGTFRAYKLYGFHWELGVMSSARASVCTLFFASSKLSAC